MSFAFGPVDHSSQENRRFAVLLEPGTYLMQLVAAAMLLATLAAVWTARHWPLVHDAPLLHYVVFLMDHGRAPYRDIVEMNMPGAYVMEWCVMHTLGGGAAEWKLFDLLSGVAAIAASAWIAGAGRRTAGVAAGAFAYMIHLAHGPANLGQRDWIIAVMSLAAFGFMFKAIRENRPTWMSGFMLLCVFGASIKPPLLVIAILFFAATCRLLSRARGEVDSQLSDPAPDWIASGERGERIAYVGNQVRRLAVWQSLTWWSLVGASVPSALVVIFLLRWGVMQSFLDSLHGLVPRYAGLGRLQISQLMMLSRSIATPVKPLVFCASILFLLNKSWRRWESCLLVAGALAGGALFVAQGKGFVYHLYTAIAFAALWAMLELDRAIKHGIRLRLIALAGLAFTFIFTVPALLRAERDALQMMDTITHLETDLYRLGGSQLSGKVQCLDMTLGGCINVLYRMKLVQSTGFIYDYYLFPKQSDATTLALQTRFLSEVTARPPEVIVFSSHTWPEEINSYEQLQNWPAFGDFLQRRYKLVKELPNQRETSGYRIYALKDDPLS